MKRQLLCALACGLTALPAFAAADLDAVLLHESRTVTADGVTRTTMYRERMVRRDGHVWVERVLPVAAAGGGHGDDHDHGMFAPLKIFALLTAIGLFVTTLIGLTIALGTRAMRRRSLIVLVLGVVVPVALLIL